MDNPECTLLSVVKVEDDLKELKEEPVNEDAELEFMQVEDSLSLDEASVEQGAADDSRDALVMFSEDELARCNRPFSCSKVDMGQRRRLRFSEADDMVLLRRVASLNPYKCSALWKDVTQVVAVRAGKNFSVRSIRDHTDLLMNTYSLRGVEACLKRTPPDLWEKKKCLLQIVRGMWKRDSLSAKLSAGSTASSKRPGKESAASDLPGLQNNIAGVETPNLDSEPNSDSSVSKSITSQTALTCDNPMSSVLRSPSVPLLMQPQNNPVELHFNTPAPSMACPPLLASTLPTNIQQLAFSAQLGLQKLAVPSVFPFPAWGRPVLPKLLPTQSPSSSSDLVTDMISDQPLPLVSRCSPAPDDSPVPEMVDQCTSPIPSVCSSSTENGSVSSIDGPVASQVPSSGTSTELDTHVTSAALRRSEQRSDSSVVKRTARTSSLLRAKLLFLQARHRDEYALRVKELGLRKQRLALEARKLDLEERKVRLEEEKWKVEKKEREEKLLLMSEERQNKMALERRQQNMIDILLELKKKE